MLKIESKNIFKIIISRLKKGCYPVTLDRTKEKRRVWVEGISGPATKKKNFFLRLSLNYARRAGIILSILVELLDELEQGPDLVRRGRQNDPQVGW